MKEIPKAYEPQNYEDYIYKRWENSGFFDPDKCVEKGVTDSSADAFSIVLPPPNVTGTLHMGHAAMLAIEDVMIRYHRMKGDRTLWVPGTDHAAIATQSKVEKNILEKEGKTRHDLGRTELLRRIGEFARQSHDTIVNQCKKMGSSLDWSREAFTLDEERNLAVRTVFKKMYDDGLIYRGYRAVNWSAKGQSTLSDDEIVHTQRAGKLYTFKYSEDFPFTIATTRPETKLGDTAVAVNPKDDRYKQYLNKEFEVDFLGQKLKIKVIGDEGVDMEFGTGALGVTPAHSKVDYDMAQKNDLPLVKVIGEDGKITDEGGKYVGLDILEARKRIVEDLKKADLFVSEEEISQNIGTSDRYEDVVEVLPKLQWFIDVNKKFALKKSNIDGIEDGQEVSLKELMQTVVNNNQIRIIPQRFEKTYFHWIDNLRDWCISRQIWYGHQVPAWYREEEIFVGLEAPEGEGWEQDPDTLDTWFSSGLWTFSTLGWPNDTQDLKNYHPNSVMETGYDILFFWVARMILMTTYCLGEIPFETIYLHGLVRDEQGRKMSKSLGNVIDPLDVSSKYGTDAVRLALLIGSTPGNDSKLSENKIAGFRNFANKLWNISRFMFMNIDEPKMAIDDIKVQTLADRWILNKLTTVSTEVTKNIEEYRFSMAGEKLRDFTWNELADWYLEIAKIEGCKSEILNHILNTILKLWHPYMPFVTEAVWTEIYGKENMLMIQKWPSADISKTDVADFDLIKSIVVKIRSIRADYKVDPAKKLNAIVSAGSKMGILNSNQTVLKGLARLKRLQIENNINKPSGSVSFVSSGVEVFVDLEGVVDFEKEKKRLNTEIVQLEKYLSSVAKKLNNEKFVDSAPAEVVEKEREKLDEGNKKLSKLKSQFDSLN